MIGFLMRIVDDGGTVGNALGFGGSTVRRLDGGGGAGTASSALNSLRTTDVCGGTDGNEVGREANRFSLLGGRASSKIPFDSRFQASWTLSGRKDGTSFTPKVIRRHRTCSVRSSTASLQSRRCAQTKLSDRLSRSGRIASSMTIPAGILCAACKGLASLPRRPQNQQTVSIVLGFSPLNRDVSDAVIGRPRERNVFHSSWVKNIATVIQHPRRASPFHAAPRTAPPDLAKPCLGSPSLAAPRIP